MDDLCREQASYLQSVGDRVTPAPGLRTSAGMLRILQLTSAAAASQLDETKKARDEATKQADVERDSLAAARRDRRTLERLKEEKLGQWREGDVRDERKTMDEIAGRSRGQP